MESSAYKLEPDFFRSESINGQVYNFSSPRAYHGKICGNIFNAFMNFLKGKRCQVFSQIDVFFENASKDYVCPDVMVICDTNKIIEDRIWGSPDLVVEILSPSTSKYDKGLKKDFYENVGVKELWLVNSYDKTIDVYLLNSENKYYLDEVYTIFEMSRNPNNIEKNALKPIIKTSLYGDDFTIELSEIFAPIV
ncbi:hypothetical protein FACS1894132_03740 [Clostridia bacterium]|nr:hypothetical protein FACS1894132_03740 [Clostridia bacterium]